MGAAGGGGGASLTVMLTEALPSRPPESVTEAVIRWPPTPRVRAKLAPPPMGPSMLEVHARLGLMSPSSGSMAVPMKAIRSLAEKVAPSAG